MFLSEPTPATPPRSISHCSYCWLVDCVCTSLLSRTLPVGISRRPQSECRSKIGEIVPNHWTAFKQIHAVFLFFSNPTSAVVFKSVSSPRGTVSHYFFSSNSFIFPSCLTCSWVTGMRRCLESSLSVPTSVLMSSLQPTSTTLALGQNSCVSPCHCKNKNPGEMHERIHQI